MSLLACDSGRSQQLYNTTCYCTTAQQKIVGNKAALQQVDNLQLQPNCRVLNTSPNRIHTAQLPWNAMEPANVISLGQRQLCTCCTTPNLLLLLLLLLLAHTAQPPHSISALTAVQPMYNATMLLLLLSSSCYCSAAAATACGPAAAAAPYPVCLCAR
jgi:hypothetical protein